MKYEVDQRAVLIGKGIVNTGGAYSFENVQNYMFTFWEDLGISYCPFVFVRILRFTTLIFVLSVKKVGEYNIGSSYLVHTLMMESRSYLPIYPYLPICHFFLTLTS